MGLLKAGVGALGGVLADQWREFFYCESLDADTLVVKGEKKIGGRSSNKRGEDNIISNGSIISINEGQSMIIVESGKIVDFSAEPGEYVYDKSTEPSLFYGGLGEGIKKSFEQVKQRFTFGGDTGKDQRVYYFNMKEITGNKFGTASPIPFRVIVDEALGYKLSVDLRCNGVYSYKIVDPLMFYKNVCANVEEYYDRSSLDDMLKGELMDALQPALATLAAQKIMYYEIPAHTKEISQALRDELAEQWRQDRGLEMFKLSFNSVTIPEDQRKKITEWEETAMSTNQTTAASRLVEGQVEAMKTAAANQGGMGAMGGFFGMNMAQSMGGNNMAANLYAQGQQQSAQNAPQSAPAQPQLHQNSWTCSCGNVNSGKFCEECGKPQPSSESWTCSCGAVNSGKFCQNCGTPKPQSAAKYKCSNCGWEPADPANPPKFCPQCGDKFDDNDKY